MKNILVLIEILENSLIPLYRIEIYREIKSNNFVGPV